MDNIRQQLRTLIEALSIEDALPHLLNAEKVYHLTCRDMLEIVFLLRKLDGNPTRLNRAVAMAAYLRTVRGGNGSLEFGQVAQPMTLEETSQQIALAIDQLAAAETPEDRRRAETRLRELNYALTEFTKQRRASMISVSEQIKYIIQRAALRAEEKYLALAKAAFALELVLRSVWISCADTKQQAGAGDAPGANTSADAEDGDTSPWEEIGKVRGFCPGPPRTHITQKILSRRD